MSSLVRYVNESWPGWLCMGVIFPSIVYLYQRIRATRSGMRALLRADIIRLYNKYHEDRKYCPIYVKSALEDEYNQYHALGGNGVITKLYEELMELPTEEMDEEL